MSVRDDCIERYLDDLLAQLRGAPADVRRMLTETEQHLYASTADGVAAGAVPDVAAADAVRRFGSAETVARQWNASAPAEPTGVLLRQLAGQMAPLVGVGLVAIGLSGLAARAMTAIWGLRFMFANPPGTTYPAAACQYWMSLHPSARSCTGAYLAESFADGLVARFAAGLLGLAVLSVVAVVRRRKGRPLLAMPRLLVSFSGAATFSLATMALIALGVDALRVAGGNGAGQWLSGAVVALPVAIGYAWAFLSSGRRTAVLP